MTSKYKCPKCNMRLKTDRGCKTHSKKFRHYGDYKNPLWKTASNINKASLGGKDGKM